MLMFSCYCIFNTNKITKIDEIRVKHLQFIKDNIDSMIYGGVIQDKEGIHKGILMVLKTNSLKEAKEFIQNDPYFELYKSYQIDYFTQKIPNI